ncbi:MAG: hypothetical protein JXX29_17250 [Deltaproteobacteria bacterium]|nr:hypothetical protein [Deltaproteobacteria bacterium]MBN2673433.1 hypothetical protein [Deltaproteobacteria bacterium]
MKTVLKLLVVVLALAFLSGCGGDADSNAQKDQNKNVVTEKIKLDIHIMSKCTWSAKVLTTLFPILEKMEENVDFNVHYIAREENGEWKSSHGESELQGDMLQLCVHKEGSQSQWLSFLKCQVKNWRKIPTGWEECAQKAKLDTAGIKTCAEGDEGKKLLVESFKYSQGKEAKGSPTIFLAGEPYTGGRTEASFGRAICDKFTTSKPEYCANIPEPIKVPVTIITDKRCEGRTCNPRRFLAFVSNTFEGAEIRTLDYSDKEGKAIFEKSGQSYLPIAVFGASVTKVQAGFSRLQRHFEKLDSGEYVYPLGRHGKPPWDPTAEICDDGVDNTGNGKTDCEDETCASRKVCRQEIPGKLDLFVMSHCPYGVRTVNAMKPVLDHFGNDRSQIDFHLQFIGTVSDDKLSSMHGEREVNEDKRQICAQKYYPKSYKFMDYILCRNDAFQKNHGREDENSWEECAKDGIASAIIKKCAESEEGEQLLAESFTLASDLNLTGSPSWLMNNRFDLRARAPRQIKDAYCEKNADIANCEKNMDIVDAPLSPVPMGSCGGTPPALKKPIKAMRPQKADLPATSKAPTVSQPQPKTQPEL